MEIVPWPHTSTPGPSREQWLDWNNEHGAGLRMACTLMMQTKDKLADFAGELERDGTFDDNLKMYDGSIKFFKEMAKVIEGAKLRLLVGDAVYGMRLGKPPRRKPRLTLVKSGEAVQS